jgi:hypothetical protein
MCLCVARPPYRHSVESGFGDILDFVENDCYWAHVRSIDYASSQAMTC